MEKQNQMYAYKETNTNNYRVITCLRRMRNLYEFVNNCQMNQICKCQGIQSEDQIDVKKKSKEQVNF